MKNIIFLLSVVLLCPTTWAHSAKDLVSLVCEGSYEGSGLNLDGYFSYPSEYANPGEIRSDWFNHNSIGEVSFAQYSIDYVIETATTITIGGNDPYAEQEHNPTNGEAIQISKADGAAIFCPYDGKVYPGTCTEHFGRGTCKVVWKQ